MSCKKILLIIAFWVCNIAVYAQTGTAIDTEVEAKPALETRMVLKFAPLSLIDFYSSIEFALEGKVGRKSTFQIEGGYINSLLQGQEVYQYKNFQDMKGYRLRSELRYYLVLNANRSGGLYLAPELLFIHVNYNRDAVFGINVTGMQGYDYYQNINYEVNKNVLGFHAKVGYQKKISKILFLDFYAGVGGRHVYINSNKPNINLGKTLVHDGQWFDEFNFYDLKDEGAYYRISASLGFKIGFLLL